MRINDGPAYRQPHPCSTGLGGVESLEDALAIRWIDPRTGIVHCHEDACLILLCADQQLSSPGLDQAHCFNGVQDEIQQHLLQLNAIPTKGTQSVRKACLDRDTIAQNRASRQYSYLVDRLIEVESISLRRRLLELITHPADDIRSSVGIPDDTAERLFGVVQVRRT